MCSFFNYFFHPLNKNCVNNLDLITKLFIPIITYSFNKKYSLVKIRKLAQFYYYITSGFAGMTFDLTSIPDEAYNKEIDDKNTSLWPLSNRKYLRLNLINSILDEIMEKFVKKNDYNQIQRWLEILIEFNLHPNDVLYDDFDNKTENEPNRISALKYLSGILVHLENLIVN